MKYAFTNGVILDGTRDMTPREGLCVLVEGEKITGMVPRTELPEGYTEIDLAGK